MDASMRGSLIVGKRTVSRTPTTGTPRSPGRVPIALTLVGHLHRSAAGDGPSCCASAGETSVSLLPVSTRRRNEPRLLIRAGRKHEIVGFAGITLNAYGPLRASVTAAEM